MVRGALWVGTMPGDGDPQARDLPAARGHRRGRGRGNPAGFLLHLLPAEGRDVDARVEFALPFDAKQLRLRMDAIVAGAGERASGNETSVHFAEWLRLHREQWADATLVQLVADLLAEDEELAGRAERARYALLLISAAEDLQVDVAPETRRSLEELKAQALIWSVCYPHR